MLQVYLIKWWSVFIVHSLQTPAVLRSLPLPWEEVNPRQNPTFQGLGPRPRAPAPAAVVNWAPVTAGVWAWAEEGPWLPIPSVLVTTRRCLACSSAPASKPPLSSGRERPVKWTLHWASRRTEGEVRKKMYRNVHHTKSSNVLLLNKATNDVRWIQLFYFFNNKQAK